MDPKTRTAGSSTTVTSLATPAQGWRRKIADLHGLSIAFTVLFILLLGTLLAWQYTQQVVSERAKTRFENQVREIAILMTERFTAYRNALQGFTVLFEGFEGTGAVPRDTFATYYKTLNLEERYPGMVAVDFAERVPASQKAAFIHAMQAETSLMPFGGPQFTVYPEGERAEYFVVKYVEPFARYGQLRGFDLGSEPTRLKALEHAGDTGELTMTGRLVLLTDLESEPGLLILMPVYRHGAPRATVDQRRSALMGFVVGLVSAEDLFAHLVSRRRPDPAIECELFDGDAMTASQLLYDSNPKRLQAAATPQPPLSMRIRLEIAGRTWTLYCSSAPTFGVRTEAGMLQLFVLLGGLTFSLLVFGILYVLATSRDQALRMAERMTSELRRQYELLQVHDRALAATLSGVVIIDACQPQHPIIDCNRAFEKLTGYTRAELIGRSWNVLHHFNQNPAALGELQQAIQERRDCRLILQHARKGGSWFWSELSLSPVFDERGQLVHLILIQHDISERQHADEQRQLQAAALQRNNEELARREKAMQSLLEDLQVSKERLEEQGRQLTNSNQRLKALAALKDEFVAKVSHELRTPLTSIKEGLSLLLDNALGDTTAEQQDFLTTMDHDLDRLAALINNMLDISKIEAGRMRLLRRRVDLRQLLESLQKSYQPIIGHRPIETDCTDIPPVFADADRIIQVFTNLFSNAIKFTADDGIIRFRTMQRDGMVAVAVEDNGPGVAPEELPKLFQKFSQVGPQGAGRPRGTGLGLALCKELTELHGGRIEVASELGRGTTFTVSLPIYTDELALRDSLQELLTQADQEKGEGVGLMAIQMQAFLPTGTDDARRAALERLAEDIRRQVHRGDVVLALGSVWVVVLANTGANGFQAMVRRIRGSSSQGERLRCGVAVYPEHGTEAMALFRYATQRANDDVAYQAAPQDPQAAPSQEWKG